MPTDAGFCKPAAKIVRRRPRIASYVPTLYSRCACAVHALATRCPLIASHTSHTPYLCRPTAAPACVGRSSRLGKLNLDL